MNKIILFWIVFIFLLISTLYVVDLNKKEVIEFPDGCKETWQRGELISDFLCNEGRAMTKNEMQDLQ